MLTDPAFVAPIIDSAGNLSDEFQRYFSDRFATDSMINGQRVTFDAPPQGRVGEYPDGWQDGRPYWTYPMDIPVVDNGQPSDSEFVPEIFIVNAAEKIGAAIEDVSAGAVQTIGTLGKDVLQSIARGALKGAGDLDAKTLAFWAGLLVVAAGGVLGAVWIYKRV
jgi:hypothetical protein